MKVPHKHAALIKAWADGAVIQVQMKSGWWEECIRPVWNLTAVYRVKPERVEEFVNAHYFKDVPIISDAGPYNLKLVFEDRKLVGAEVLK